MHDYAKTQPQVTFINGCSGALETTYVNPAPNFFRFNIDGAQMQKGLGEYIYNVKHYKKIATIGEDYAFIYTQVFGLALDYCPAGGQIAKRLWVPLGTKDFASYIPQLLSLDVDAIYLGLGGADALNFLNQYEQAGGNAKLIGGSIMVDQTVLSSKGKAKEVLLGTASAGPQADTWDDPKWQAFVKAYQQAPNEGYFRKSLHRPFALRNQLLRRDGSRAPCARQGQRRPQRRPEEIPGSLGIACARRSERTDKARREPPSNRNELRH